MKTVRYTKKEMNTRVKVLSIIRDRKLAKRETPSVKLTSDIESLQICINLMSC